MAMTPEDETAETTSLRPILRHAMADVLMLAAHCVAAICIWVAFTGVACAIHWVGSIVSDDTQANPYFRVMFFFVERFMLALGCVMMTFFLLAGAIEMISRRAKIWRRMGSPESKNSTSERRSQADSSANY